MKSNLELISKGSKKLETLKKEREALSTEEEKMGAFQKNRLFKRVAVNICNNIK